MRKYNVNQEFNVVVSTKATLFGAKASDFRVYYAPTNNLLSRIDVAGGLIEVVTPLDTPKSATVAVGANYGAHTIDVSASHDFEAGDVIQYALGKMAYITKVVGDKIYLKTRLKSSILAGDEILQVGNKGLYITADFAIAQEGEYLLSIEAPEYGIMVESRIGASDEVAGTGNDGGTLVYSEIAVAY